MARILVVDDDVKMAEGLGALLVIRGHSVEIASDGGAALLSAAVRPPDLMILDLHLPTLDGEQVLRSLSSAGGSLPVLVLTGSRIDVTDEIRGLDLGAVDYVRKGVPTEILLARIEAALRRPSSIRTTTISAGRVVLDSLTGTVLVDGVRRTVPPRPFRLLMCLIASARVVPKEDIARAVLGSNLHLYDHAVEQVVHQARKCLGDRKWIRTVRGRGYEFDRNPN